MSGRLSPDCLARVLSDLAVGSIQVCYSTMTMEMPNCSKPVKQGMAVKPFWTTTANHN